MKKQFLRMGCAVLLCFAASCAFTQVTAKEDGKGSYFEVKAEKPAATFESLTSNAEKTGKTFTDKTKKVHDLYRSKSGKLFYVRTSKAGTLYRCYIKIS